MAVRYQHTQRGTVMIAVLIAGVVACSLAAWLNLTPMRWVLVALAVVSAVMIGVFYSLTVAVSDGQLKWYFGFGVWTYSMPLTDISSVRIVRNSVFNSFGIRMRPGFRLYNVSGLDAVELQLKTGGIRHIGTDDPKGLAAAIQGA